MKLGDQTPANLRRLAKISRERGDHKVADELERLAKEKENKRNA